ncbi:DUF4350 domain-containing protein [Microbacterium sp. MPKO10]|uniref:DUF4350 domain-containing protein n=1 Tax=Microbacterium sp. MPKO10 TaxID=2989818 RepID=UPI002235E4FA|nr:DUF4350 domain-containing protein [Microbacterium sp. MPKO10]MCW4458453.1 DUF4350 domain-containing protein [Microbacterium sp. MPKO10]
MTVTETLTPNVRTRLRRSLFWIVCTVGALIVALIAIALSGGNQAQSRPLQADSATPTGAKGVVTVLEDHGVSVTAADSATDAADSLNGDVTLFVYDAEGFLETSNLADLAAQASDVVVLTPDFQTLRALAPGVLAGGTEATDADPVSARCDIAAAERAETAEVLYTYRITDAPNATGCFPVSDGRFGLISLPQDDGTLTVLGNPGALSNEKILHGGNAALALSLLGQNDELVWYLPTIADVQAHQPPTLGELTPPWVVPFTTLLAVTALAAMFWRGRRLGPVVVEKMPVHVPARETVEGRARLYERGNAREHAIDALRIGAISRIARLLGLPAGATALQVADAAASVLGHDVHDVRAALVEEQPASDQQLMAISSAVSDIEKRVRATLDETGRM